MKTPTPDSSKGCLPAASFRFLPTILPAVSVRSVKNERYFCVQTGSIWGTIGRAFGPSSITSGRVGISCCDSCLPVRSDHAGSSTLALTVCASPSCCSNKARVRFHDRRDALRFFNNVFVTGSYVVAGVGLWNTGSGSINMASPTAPMTAAPAGAEVLAAYLYWQVVTSLDPDVVDLHATSTFNGAPLRTPLDWDLAPTAVGAGGTNACLLNGGNGSKVYTFRSDVQRYLDVDPQTGRRIINKQGGYPVTLPRTNTARTLGASLVVIYRHPDPTPATPLNAIVLYDGTFVKHQPVDAPISGSKGSTIRRTLPGQNHVHRRQCADRNLNEVLRIDTDGDSARLLESARSGPVRWRIGECLGQRHATDGRADRTRQGERVSRHVDRATDERVAWLAGQRLRGVGRHHLPDAGQRWGFGRPARQVGVVCRFDPDPRGEAAAGFQEHGRGPGDSDVFIEVAAMRAAADTTYGSDAFPLRESLHSVTDEFGHNHMPPPAALQMLGDEFASARHQAALRRRAP